MFIRGLGTVAHVDVDLTSAWSRCLVDPTDDALEIPVSSHDEAALVTQTVTRALIRHMAGQYFLFHAAALCDPATGAAVVAVASSGTGKTTFVSRQATRFGYITDETAAVAFDGSIAPYPKPLSFRRDSHLVKAEVGPDELGLVRAPDHPFLAKIVVLERTDAEQPRTEDLDTLDAIEAVAPNMSSLSRVPSCLQRLAGLIEGTGGVQRWVYREADQLGPLIASAIGARHD